MLYGQLKTIMEADDATKEEPKLDDEGNPIEEPKEKAKKTRAQLKKEKEFTDGEGNYNDDMMKMIAKALRANDAIKFSDIKASNNALVLILKKKASLEEMNAMQPKIELLISAAMESEFDNYNLGNIIIDDKNQTFTFMVVKKPTDTPEA